jgi:hypothetical protein
VLSKKNQWQERVGSIKNTNMWKVIQEEGMKGIKEGKEGMRIQKKSLPIEFQ